MNAPIDKDYIQSLKPTFERLAKSDTSGIEGASIVRDEKGEVIPGVLCLDTGKDGKDVAVVVATHMNELVGFRAVENVLDRWQKGDRPPAGKIYLCIGGDVDTVRECFDDVLSDHPTKSLTEFRQIKMENGDPFDFNRVPRGIRFDNPRNIYEKRVADLTKAVYINTDSLVDIHTTSTEGMPMALPWIPKDTDKETAMQTAHQATKDMPLDTVFMDLLPVLAGENTCSLKECYQTQNNIKGYGESSTPSLIVECGGPHLSTDGIPDMAIKLCQIYLHNTLNWQRTCTVTAPEKTYFYQNTQPVKHPQNDKNYIMIQGPETLLDNTLFGEEKYKTRQYLIDKEQIAGKRLANGARVEEGQLLAISTDLSSEIRASQSGYVFMAPSDPRVKKDQAGMFIVQCDEKDKDLPQSSKGKQA